MEVEGAHKITYTILVGSTILVPFIGLATYLASGASLKKHPLWYLKSKGFFKIDTGMKFLFKYTIIFVRIGKAPKLFKIIFDHLIGFVTRASYRVQSLKKVGRGTFSKH